MMAASEGKTFLLTIVVIFSIQLSSGLHPDADYCNLESVTSFKKSPKTNLSEDDNSKEKKGKTYRIEDAAASLGITSPEEIEEFQNTLMKCCDPSLRCWENGGKCLPSWLKIFLPCYIDHLCTGTTKCTCFHHSSACKCYGSCSLGGHCRPKNSCHSDEVPFPLHMCSSGDDSCDCCVRCDGTCGVNGICKKSCDTNTEIDSGPCMEASLCRCCQPRIVVSTDCVVGLRCGIWPIGVCSPSCPSNYYQVPGQCSGNCICCVDKYDGHYASKRN